MFATIILGLAILLAPAQASAEPSQRIEMIRSVAWSVTEDPRGWPGFTHRQRYAALMTKIRYESGRFDIRVHDGRKRGDAGKSICLGQIKWGPWLKMSRDEWEALAGTTRAATRRCLALSWHFLTAAKRGCYSRAAPSVPVMSVVYWSYGTGAPGCRSAEWSEERAASWLAMVRSER